MKIWKRGLWVMAIMGISMGAACSGTSSKDNTSVEVWDIPQVIEVAATDGPFETVLAQDLAPQENVVEVALEAKVVTIAVTPETNVSMWTYNGVFPGPRIEAKVGDTVRVTLKNSLPETTTIHWHGIRVPAAMDGMPTIQSPIGVGEEFTYEFVVPDAGTFWYHPHIRSDEQVERGLVGVLIVRGADEPLTTTDRVFVLDDLLVGSDGELVPFDAMHAMVGRQGNVVVVNGRANPIVPMEPKGLHRFRFVNAANARYFRLALEGYELIQIASDGGLLEKPQTTGEILLVPGERAEVLVVAKAKSGVVNEWKSLPYDRGHGTGALPAVPVFQSKTNGDVVVTTPVIPTQLRTIESLPTPQVTRTVKLEESMGDMSGGGHGGHAGHGATGGGMMMEPTFSFNGKTWPDGEMFQGKLGQVEEWKLNNTTEMDHPFHLHGFRFQVVDNNGEAPEFQAWRDTINVPAKKTTTLRVRLEDHPGQWMFHCHILEHAERGMMGMLEVE